MKSRDINNELRTILKKCAKITQKNPPTLQALGFPPNDYWRFFIKVNKHNKGEIYLNYLYKLYDDVLKKIKIRAQKITTDKSKEGKEKNSNLQENEALKKFLMLSDEEKENMLHLIFHQPLSALEKMANTQLIIHEFNSFFQECKSVIAEAKKELDCQTLPKRLANITLEQLLKYCKGWLPQEIAEPGSIAAFVSQISKVGIAETKQTPQNAEAFAEDQIKLIKRFHGNVIKNVDGITRNETYPGKKGDYAFRESREVGFQMILGVNVTKKGLNESKARHDSLKKVFSAYQQNVNIKNGTGMYTSTLHCKADKTEHQLELIMPFLLKEYYNKAKGITDPLKKLILIILVRDMEQLHPFDDGNCRTICILYYNHLLISNHFPPSMLVNANRFDGFSIEELLSDTIEGMQNTFRIINQEALQGITTQEIIDFLQENGFTKEHMYAKKLFPLLSSPQRKHKILEPPSSIPAPKNLSKLDAKSEQKYLDALQVLKKYIETHPWEIVIGGSIIELDKDKKQSVSICVPKTIFLQWNAIHDKKKSPKENYNEVIDIAIKANQLSQLSQFFKGRRSDTIEYLSKFTPE
jgi:hypothetical protein